MQLKDKTVSLFIIIFRKLVEIVILRNIEKNMLVNIEIIHRKLNRNTIRNKLFIKHFIFPRLLYKLEMKENFA